MSDPIAPAGRVVVISATRLTEKAFWEESALGLSLKRLCLIDDIEYQIEFCNSQSLALIYNKAILANSLDSILLFVHDDVWIDDYYLCIRLKEGLQKFDIIGLAGITKRVPMQVTWVPEGFMKPGNNTKSLKLMSGSVGHGERPGGIADWYGEVAQQCVLLDGVFLAAKAATLVDANCLFDNRFSFHFYDLDFCRTAEQLGLRAGTWPIAITHQSGGNFNSDAWRQAAAVYIDKWKS